VALGRRPRPLVRLTRRLLVLGAYGAAACAIWFVVITPLHRPSTPAAARAATAPARPAGIPAHVPAWAWQLLRGKHPASAPKPLPAWYARWRAWRLGASG
jgi:hypothetical protein